MSIYSAQSGITRRRVLTVAALVVASAATLTGCSGGGNSSGGGTSATQTLTIAAQSAPISFDPAKGANGGTQTMYQELAYQSLVERTSDGGLGPGLATEWGYVPGKEGKEFSLTLRKDAKFSDGSPVNASAVAASLNYFAKNATGSSSASFASLSASADGEDKVLITSSTPNPIIDELLQQYNLGGFIVSPAGLADPKALANASFGAGPYVYDPSQSVTNDHYVFTPNKYYYDQGRIHFQKVVVKVITNNTSAMSALRTGQIQLFSGDVSQVKDAQSAGASVESAENAFSGLFFLDWEGKIVPALGQEKVRQALNYAVDRASIASAVFGEYAVGTTQPNTPGWDGYDPQLENAYPYDVNKAKALLAEAGYADGFSFELMYTAFEPTTTKVVQAVADQLSKVGVKVNLKGVQNFSEYSAALTAGTAGATSLTWGGQTQFANTNQLWMPNGALNPLKNNVPGLPEAFSAYTQSTPDTRVEKGRAVEKLVVDQALTLPVARQKAPWFVGKTLQGFKLDPSGNPNNIVDWTISK